LQLTLERWRWLPTDFSAPPIVVNIPDFRLRALDENNNIAFEMRVVVGKAMRTQTPVFSRDMTFIVLRPYWNIPPGIFRRSVLPAIQRDRGEVARRNYEITTIDGKVVTARRPGVFPYLRVANIKRTLCYHAPMDEGRKRIIAIMASILAARKLSQYDSGARIPATINAIADAVRWAARIMEEIDRHWPAKRM